MIHWFSLVVKYRTNTRPVGQPINPAQTERYSAAARVSATPDAGVVSLLGQWRVVEPGADIVTDGSIEWQSDMDATPVEHLPPLASMLDEYGAGIRPVPEAPKAPAPAPVPVPVPVPDAPVPENVLTFPSEPPDNGPAPDVLF